MKKEIKTQTNKELLKQLNDKREAIRGFRFGLSGSKTRNIREGRNFRKEVARILTELSSRATKV